MSSSVSIIICPARITQFVMRSTQTSCICPCDTR